MEHISGTSALVKYLPGCLAILAMSFWLIHFKIRKTLSRYEKMKELQQWNDLPRLSATQNKEETLDNMINAECDKISVSFNISLVISLIAVAVLILPL